MTITTEDIREAVLADATDLGVTDAESIMILAIGRSAQAALANEVAAITADGAAAADIAAYREERGAQLDRWMAGQTEKVRVRRMIYDEVERCMG